MLKIAIVDDENIVCSQIEKVLINTAIEENMKFDIDVYYSGKKICEHLKSNECCYDVIFLDIEMQGFNGVEVGNFIRNILKNDAMQIIYISGKTEYALDLFQFSPLDFIVKPLRQQKISEVIKKAIRILGICSDVFCYKSEKGIVQVSVRDILCFESLDRKIQITTIEGDDRFYGSLEDIHKQLKKFGFFYCHRSYIVNYRHIKLFSYALLELDNGKSVPVSRSKRTEVQQLQLQMESGYSYV